MRFSSEKITILGAGVWGRTLASIYGHSGKHVSLWSRNRNKLAQQTAGTVNVCDDLQQAVIDAAIVIFAVTSQSVRTVAQQLALVFGHSSDKRSTVLVSAVKGLELESTKTMCTVISDCLPGYSVAALSGPNLASEIIAGLPAASVIACSDAGLAQHLQMALSTENFRVYAGTDVIGTELGGALKNIIAIAAGFADGMGLGANARAAIVTRGLAEISRLAAASGAKPETLSGLSGMGDLIATCTSALSRNYQLGAALAHGETTSEALKHLIGTAEGVFTCDAVCTLAKKLNVELPIAQQVQLLLQGKISPTDTITNLMRRPLTRE